MAEGRATFGGSMPTSGELHHLLAQEKITPEMLFAVANISNDIKQNIQVFLNFCRKNRQFTTRLLTIALNSPYEDLQNEEVKKVAQYSIDIMTNDEDALANFLFDKKAETNNSQEVTEDISIETPPTITKEVDKLFNDSPTKNQQPLWEKKQDAFEKYQLVTLTLAHLKEDLKNETCLGYINKLYSSLLRREGILFLQFLKEKPQNIQLLVQNINHFSVGNMVALLVSCEDKSGEYKHEDIKKHIFNKILQYGFDNTEQSDNFNGFLACVQEIMNSTKQSYYQYFQDFKRCANMLVSEQTLGKFYSALQKNQVSFHNASSYLDLVLKRISSEVEQHDYYKQAQSNEPTMNFQHGFLFQKLNKLLEWIQKSCTYSSLTRVTFLEFIIKLIKNSKQKLQSYEMFKQLYTYLNEQQNKGLVKNYLYQLIKVLIQKMNDKDIESCSQWILSAAPSDNHLIQIYEGNCVINKNNNLHYCFIVDILFQFHTKNNQFLTQYFNKNKVNLLETYDKFKFKLANYGEDQPQSPNCDQVELTLKFSKETNNLFLPSKKEDTQETQTVGKNNVMIPVLNLPNKLENTKIIIEEEQVEQVNIPSQMTRQDIIRDLKNTRIELPNKFKLKKVPETTENNVEDQKEIKNTFKLKIPEQREVVEIIQNNFGHSAIPEIPQSPVFVQIEADPNEKKYFIRHILLF